MSAHDGHRGRIIKKLDQDILLDHELLEVLLFNAQPRKNTNDIAHALLAKFGAIDDIFRATTQQLEEVDGVGQSIAAYLFCIGKFYKKYFDLNKKEYEGKYEASKFLPFVKRAYRNEPREVLDLYLLDAEGLVFEQYRFSVSSSFEVALKPEEMTALLLREKPSGIVMVHNHPTGNAFPSEKDEHVTSKLQLACSFHNVLLCDHVIYAPNGIYSYYLSGRLRDISNNYSVASILEEGNERKQ